MSQTRQSVRKRHSTNIPESDEALLARIHEVLAVPTGKSQLPSLRGDDGMLFDAFSRRFESKRQFSSHPEADGFEQMLTLLVQQRLANSVWLDTAPVEDQLRLFVCLRILLRDSSLRDRFLALRGAEPLIEHTKQISLRYWKDADPHLAECLCQITNAIQKLSGDNRASKLVAMGAGEALLPLLSANDLAVLQGALHALRALGCKSLATQSIVGPLLDIIKSGEAECRRLAASLLRTLAKEDVVKAEIVADDGVAPLVSMLRESDPQLQTELAACLTTLSSDASVADTIRLCGGVPFLVNVLSESKDESVRSACIQALTELSLHDACAHEVVNCNGLLALGMLLIELDSSARIQAYALRCLRFLFSLARHRRALKRLLPPSLLEAFINIGHYVRDLPPYQSLAADLRSVPEEDRAFLREGISNLDARKQPSHSIRDYQVLECLGAGAFGAVYKVRRGRDGPFFALKEISAHGNDELANEVEIIRQGLKHPNVVQYMKTFTEGERLYIVMSLIEGASLSEHLSSLKEKGYLFEERLMWSLFSQMVLALRYLHCQKRIVHRDLTPNNVMITDKYQVVITDFGLAKLKAEGSRMHSVVGTITYCCPEIVQSLPYSDKADVWSLGCLLYQMASFRLPFMAGNMLQLASAIVEARYEPLPADTCPQKVRDVVTMCLQADSERRPHISELAAVVCDEVLDFLEEGRSEREVLERRLEKERMRAQRLQSEEGPRRSTMSAPVVRRQNSAPHRPTSAVSVSPARVRQIEDPLLQLLQPLHKLVSVCQRPPGANATPPLRLLTRFQRAIFAKGTGAAALKGHLKKLAAGSREVVELELPGDPVTYEQIQKALEQAVSECGYNDVNEPQK